jgi:hypothetical protein
MLAEEQNHRKEKEEPELIEVVDRKSDLKLDQRSAEKMLPSQNQFLSF